MLIERVIKGEFGMDQKPAPLVPKDVDLRNFPFMKLDVERLLKSDFWALTHQKPEVRGYALALWASAWHEVPAGSFADEDVILAARAGCSLQEWPEVKDLVCRGWVSCNDGRIYHRVIADQVLEAATQKEIYKARTDAARHARDAKRQIEKPVNRLPTENVTESVTVLSQTCNIDLTDTPQNSNSSVTDQSQSCNSPVTGTRIENREERIENNISSVPIGTEALPPPDESNSQKMWRLGRELLEVYEIPKSKRGALIGKWCREAKSDEHLLEIFVQANAKRPGEIEPYIQACLAEKNEDNGRELVDRFFAFEGDPTSRGTADFHVKSWIKALGAEAVAEQMEKAKANNWKRAKLIAHLNDLSHGVNLDNFKAPADSRPIQIEELPPLWITVRGEYCVNNPNAKAWLGETIRKVYVNDTSVTIWASTPTCRDNLQSYAPDLLMLFQKHKPEITDVRIQK
mgnify:CR=1 FL=1